MNLDINALETFIVIAETQSFTKAANRLGRTQSAISQQIRKLESLLDKSLIQRDQLLTLTNDGEILLSYAKQIVAKQKEAIEYLTEPQLKGEVRFGLPEDFATVLLSDVLVDFTRIHPRISLNIECDLTLNLFHRFKKGEFDLILVKMSQPEDFPYGQEVWSEPLEWVGHESQLQPIKKQYQTLPLVLSPQPCVYRSRAIDALKAVSLDWRIVYTSTSYAGTIAAVKAGLGFTVLPRTMIPKPLKPLNHHWLPSLHSTHISLLKSSTNHSALASFEQFVLERFR